MGMENISVSIEITKGKILNEYGFLYIELGKLDEAEEILNRALTFVENTNTIEEGYNAKYKGTIYKIRRNYQQAKDLFLLASTKFEEQNLYSELTEVSIYLVELNNPKPAFYKMAGDYADEQFFHKKMEGVNKYDAKIVDFIVNSVDDVDNDNNTG